MLLSGAALGADVPQTITADDGEKSLAQTWNVAADTRIEIDNVRGSVTVTGWDQPQVQLSGSLGSGSTLEVANEAQHLTLRVRGKGNGWFGGNGPNSDSDLVLKVPRAAELKLSVVSADANVSGVSGKALNVSGVSGKLTLDSDAAQVDASNVSGDIVFAATHANPNARAHLQTVSGDIKARNLAGRVKVDTTSGEIGVQAGTVSELETGTVSGDVVIHATPAAHARISLESMSGDVRLHLPATLSAHLDATTFSGSIHSDYGKVEEPERGPGSHLDARTGDGDATIHAQTFSGDIEFRRND